MNYSYPSPYELARLAMTARTAKLAETPVEAADVAIEQWGACVAALKASAQAAENREAAKPQPFRVRTWDEGAAWCREHATNPADQFPNGAAFKAAFVVYDRSTLRAGPSESEDDMRSFLADREQRRVKEAADHRAKEAERKRRAREAKKAAETPSNFFSPATQSAKPDEEPKRRAKKRTQAGA